MGGDRRTSLRAVVELMRVLKSIILAENELGAADAELLSTAISVDTSPRQGCLSHLDISANRISSSGGFAVASRLRTNSTLTSLNLAKNDLTRSGTDLAAVHELAAALSSNSTLTLLNISSNGVGDEGMRPHPGAKCGRRHRRRAQYFGLPGCRGGARLPTT